MPYICIKHYILELRTLLYNCIFYLFLFDICVDLLHKFNYQITAN